MGRRGEVVKLRKAGLTYAEIGRRLGISRERARQIVGGNPASRKADLESKVMLRSGEVARSPRQYSKAVDQKGGVAAISYFPSW